MHLSDCPGCRKRDTLSKKKPMISWGGLSVGGEGVQNLEGKSENHMF